MTKFVKIRLSSFIGLPQSPLAIYCRAIVDTIKADKDLEPVYKDLLEQIEAAVVILLGLLAITETNKKNTAQRNETVNKLLNLMRALATRIESNADGDPVYILSTGFDLYQERESHRTQELGIPRLVDAKSTGNAGELSIRIDTKSLTKGTDQIALEHSTDDGLTWKNGTYFKGGRHIVKDLPASLNVKVRVRALGTGNRISGWSKVVNTSVV